MKPLTKDYLASGKLAKLHFILTWKGFSTLEKVKYLGVEDFSNALNRIFGLGAPKIEILIMKILHGKIGEMNKLDDQNRLASDLTFTKTIELMRHNCQDSEKV